jgi:hypothetical protein
VAGKFYEGVKNGLSPEGAMNRADDYARKLMAQRAIGELPNLINSRALGFLTQFQTEVNNQASFLAKDIPEMSEKKALKIAWKLGQIALFSHVYNNLSEKIVGYRVALDPIEYIKTLVGVGEEDEEKNFIERSGEVAGEVIQNLPFVGTRLPIQGALPDFADIGRGLTKIGEGDTMSGLRYLGEGIKGPAAYLVPPVGGGQIKKTWEGLTDYARGYSQTPSGRVRFPIKQGPGSAIKQAAFGRWSSKQARDYLDKNQSILGEKQSEMFKEVAKKDKSRSQDLFARILQGRDKQRIKIKTHTDGGKKQATIDIAGNERAISDLSDKEFQALYEDSVGKVKNYGDKKVKITTGISNKNLAELQWEFDRANKFLKIAERQAPEKVFKIQLKTYSKDGPADIHVEDRAEWAAGKLKEAKAKSNEEFNKTVTRMLNAGVLTKSVTEAIRDEYGINPGKYTRAGKTYTLSGSGGSGGSGGSAPGIGAPPEFTSPTGGNIKISPMGMGEIKPIKISAPRSTTKIGSVSKLNLPQRKKVRLPWSVEQFLG